MSYLSEVLADSPVAYWRLGDSASPATDEIGTADGTASGNVTFGATSLLTSDANKAVTFPTSPGLIEIADQAALHTGDVLSVECWAARTRSGVGDEYMAVKFGNGEWFVHFGGADYAQFGVNGSGGGFRTAATITDTTRHHLVWTKNGATTHAYLDGVEGTVDTGTVIVSHATPGVIQFGLSTFIGRLDEFALYGTALSSGRVAAHYAAGIAEPTASGRSRVPGIIG